MATKRRSSKVIWIRSGWLRGSIYWVLLFRGRFFATKPLSQIQRSTLWLLQGLSPRPSFGGFGLNEVIRVYDTLPYKNIVYMGAACSIREWAALTLPYLTDHTESRFVNLCLHPIAEPREIAAIGRLPIGDLISRGSLLEWIDDMFSSPNDILDRRLGKWDNILQATHIIEDPGVRPRITLKAFDVDSGGQKPQRHGEFNGLEFWDPALWEA